MCHSCCSAQQKCRVWTIILLFLEAPADVLVLVRPAVCWSLAEAAAVQDDTSGIARREKESLRCFQSPVCCLPRCKVTIYHLQKPSHGVSAALELLMDVWQQGKIQLIPESGPSRVSQPHHGQGRCCCCAQLQHCFIRVLKKRRE